MMHKRLEINLLFLFLTEVRRLFIHFLLVTFSMQFMGQVVNMTRPILNLGTLGSDTLRKATPEALKIITNQGRVVSLSFL